MELHIKALQCFDKGKPGQLPPFLRYLSTVFQSLPVSRDIAPLLYPCFCNSRIFITSSIDSWDDFIKRHFKTLWACDFFTKTVWTTLGPKTFYALFFINVHTRKVEIAGITKNPTREWVNSQAKGLSSLFDTAEKTEKLLIRDGDGKFSKDFDKIINGFKVKVNRIPYRSPNLNSYAEGWVSLVKRECLDYFFVFGKKHFQYLVKEYVKYYNTVRPHARLKKMPLDFEIKKKNGRVKCDSMLGGIINRYYRK
ncbi:MAG: transposase [Candidatus Aureabacteria bacterium]|nr:transposase [Candidatus Auribacterota bacterium]